MPKRLVTFASARVPSKVSFLSGAAVSVAAALLLTGVFTSPSAHSQTKQKTQLEFLQACGTLSGKAYKDCFDKAKSDYKDYVEKSKTEAPPVVTQKGVCSVANATNTFYATGMLAPLNGIKKNFEDAIAGLKAKAGENGYIDDAMFGPKASPAARQSNRTSAYNLLDQAQTSFVKNVKLFATLADEECFKCAIIEKWAVLQSAVNLIGRTHNLGYDGLKVGGGSLVMLEWTGKEEVGKDTLPSPPAALDNNLRPIARKYTPRDWSSWPTQIDLGKVTDYWVSGIQTEFIEDLKSKICAIVNDPASRAYDLPAKYAAMASEVQRVVNDGFLQWPIVFKPAIDAEAEAKSSVSPTSINELTSKMGDAQCNPSSNPERQFGLRPYSFPTAINPFFCEALKSAKQ